MKTFILRCNAATYYLLIKQFMSQQISKSTGYLERLFTHHIYAFGWRK